jgi:predicted metal-binding membrane protein
LTGVATPAARRSTFGVVHGVLLGGGAVAWAVTLTWAARMDGGAMPGTMGLALPVFVLMWAVMMAAMMLPSVWPFVSVYQRTVKTARVSRLAGLVAGYLLAWALTGVAAYALARLFGNVAADRPGAARALAIATFAGVGLYQLTPLKRRCLSHCRSPLAHLFHYVSFRGPTRDARAGLYHGLYCLGCCWALMVLLVAFGVMNVPAMIGLAVVIGVEKTWRHGDRFARFVGVAALLYGAALVVEPSLAPGLDPDAARTPMAGMDGDVSRPGKQGDPMTSSTEMAPTATSAVAPGMRGS